MINLGANLECYNDDGFTPLNLTLLRYICLLNDIKRWNKYLIPQVNLKFDIKKGKFFKLLLISSGAMKRVIPLVNILEERRGRRE